MLLTTLIRHLILLLIHQFGTSVMTIVLLSATLSVYAKGATICNETALSLTPTSNSINSIATINSLLIQNDLIRGTKLQAVEMESVVGRIEFKSVYMEASSFYLMNFSAIEMKRADLNTMKRTTEIDLTGSNKINLVTINLEKANLYKIKLNTNEWIAKRLNVIQFIKVGVKNTILELNLFVSLDKMSNCLTVSGNTFFCPSNPSTSIFDSTSFCPSNKFQTILGGILTQKRSNQNPVSSLMISKYALNTMTSDQGSRHPISLIGIPCIVDVGPHDP